MKELKEPVPMVAKGEAELGLIGDIVKEIKAAYSDAFECRKKGNRKGLEIGRTILLYCDDSQLKAKLMIHNSKENKPDGGTPTKIYTYLCDELAKCSCYDADYLKNATMRFLAGANKALIKKGKEPLKPTKGVFQLFDWKTLPTVDDVLSLQDEPVKAPHIDRLFAEEKQPESEEKQLSPAEIATAFKKLFFKHFTRNGHIRLGALERLEVMKELNSQITELGFEISVKSPD